MWSAAGRYCVCRCRGGTRVHAFDGPVSFPTREDHAREFISVVSRAPSGPLEDDVEVQHEACRDATVHLRAVGHVAFFGVACPALFFACLLPLEIGGLAFELWRLYYFSVIRLVFLVFGFQLVWLGLKQGPTLLAAALFSGSCFALDATLAFLAPCVAVPIAGQFASLLFPSVYTLFACIARRHAVRHVLMHIVGLMTGAAPPMLAAACYYLLHHRGWKDQTPVLVLTMLVWSLAPLILKILGKQIWLRAAPAIPGMITVLWIYYCEVCFSCFGFLVFMHTPVSAISYALMLAPILLLQAFRGTRWGFQHMPCMGSLTLHRLIIYLDSFASVMGRVAAYTLYMSFSLLKLWRPEAGLMVVRSRLFGHEKIYMTASINMYRLQEEVDGSHLWTGLLGFVLIAAVSSALCVVIPLIWTVPASAESATATLPETLGRPAEDCGGRGCEGDVQDAGVAERGQERVLSRDSALERPAEDSMENAAVRKPSTNLAWQSDGRSATDAPQRRQETLRSGWLTGGSSAMDLLQQHKLLLKFTADFRFFLIATLVFVFAICVVTFNAMLQLIHRTSRQSCL